MRPFRSLLAGLLVALLSSVLVALTGPAAHAADADCSDFASQRAAQIFFLNHGGPRRDPHGLDREGDGIACETNPAPYYFGTNPPAPKPPPAVRSKLGLKALPTRAIAGERVKLRVQAVPRIKRTVVLQRKAPSGWKRVDSGQTSQRGRLKFRMPARPTSTKYRAVTGKTLINRTRYSAATSPVRRVITQRQSVELFLPNGALTGTLVTAIAEASPIRRGRPVVLQRLTTRGWATVERSKESRQGRARFDFAARRTGSFTYRAVVHAEDGARAVRSDRQRIQVTEPTPDDTTPPPVPTGLTAVPGDSQVALAWDAVSAVDLAEYVVYASTGDGLWTEVARGIAESVVVTDLANGTQYSFAVTAVDTSDNESTRSAAAQATPVPPDTTAPDVPTGLTTTAGDAQVTINWRPVSASDATGYHVYQRVAPNGAWARVNAAILEGTTYTATGLANGTQYDFAVTAVDDDNNESPKSDIASATPADVPPDAPTGLTATPGDGEVRLEWNPVTDIDVIGYRVYVRSSPDDAWTPAPNGLEDDTAHRATGLTNDVEYQFAVTALENDGTESDHSNVASSTPVAEPGAPQP
jgi:fibronectin type 3 domain-containing protein